MISEFSSVLEGEGQNLVQLVIEHIIGIHPP